MILQNETILLCGGEERNYKKCLQLDKGTWREHSTLNMSRIGHSAVATQTATFFFGGILSNTTYEYLPKDSNTWLTGKTNIPGGFHSGCAIASKSESEIWLIGGSTCGRRILRFNVNDHTFHSTPSRLNVRRNEPRCAFIPKTNKIMITGGFHTPTATWLDSTEMLDTEDGSITMASPMNFKRDGHGIGIVTIGNEDKLAVVGGKDGDIITHSEYHRAEFFNTQSKEWEITNALPVVHKDFGFLSVKLADIFF